MTDEQLIFDFGMPETLGRKPDPALRYDARKIRYDLLPPDGLEALALVYTKGAEKYADRNWEKGMSWSRMIGSLARHIKAFEKGEVYDPETGCHHMAMAAWNALGLCVYDLRGVGENDLPVIINRKKPTYDFGTGKQP